MRTTYYASMIPSRGRMMGAWGAFAPVNAPTKTFQSQVLPQDTSVYKAFTQNSTYTPAPPR